MQVWMVKRKGIFSFICHGTNKYILIQRGPCSPEYGRAICVLKYRVRDQETGTSSQIDERKTYSSTSVFATRNRSKKLNTLLDMEQL
jgi:hypothetical protein